MIRNLFFLFSLAVILSISESSSAQNNYKLIPLPQKINSINEEFSGMTAFNNRIYLLPQYGSFKETKLDSAFYIYSIKADSIERVIDGKDTALTRYTSISVKNLNLLPDSVKKYYEGFEAISIVNGRVFLSLETKDIYDYCFILKGELNLKKKEITIDASNFITLKRYPFIENAGFESLTYLPSEQKLIALYEFNAMPQGGTGYLIDTAFKTPPQKINVPFLPLRITDIHATNEGKIYGINYFWNGDYPSYLNNNILRHQEPYLQQTVPGLKDSLEKDPGYLQEKTTYFARIVSLDNYKANQWKHVTTFDPVKNNWEGITLFRKGALVITDANRSKKQLSTFAYFDF